MVVERVQVWRVRWPLVLVDEVAVRRQPVLRHARQKEHLRKKSSAKCVATDVNSDISIDASSRSLVILVISNFSEHCMLIRINLETKTVKWGLPWLKLCSFVNSRNISIKLGDKVYI